MAAGAADKGVWVCCAALATFLVAGPVMAQSSPAKDPSQGVVIPVPGGVFIRLSIPTKPKTKADSIVLTAEQYRQLLDRIEKLQAQIDAQRPLRPRSCELEGKLEMHGRQTIVRLRATFKFTTTQPNTIVRLGCQKAHAVEVHSDSGKKPLLTSDDDGLRVLAETAGDHSIRLDLEAPLTAQGPKGAETGFEIGLPGAPITALTFEPPANVHRYRLTTKIAQPGDALPAVPDTETEQPEADRFLPGKGGDPLGPITNLVLSWEDPNRKVDAVRSVETEIIATIAANEIVTDARLHLRGSASEWKFTAPASADVTVSVWPRAGETKAAEFAPQRAPNVLRPDAEKSLWRIVFREPFDNDLLVSIVTRQPRPRTDPKAARGPFAIGPFAALGVPQQSGTIRVRSPSNWRPTATLKGTTTREIEQATGETIYKYRQAEISTPPKDPPVTLTLIATAGSHQRARSS